jgi:hypothetical protein
MPERKSPVVTHLLRTMPSQAFVLTLDDFLWGHHTKPFLDPLPIKNKCNMLVFTLTPEGEQT